MSCCSCRSPRSWRRPANDPEPLTGEAELEASAAPVAGVQTLEEAFCDQSTAAPECQHALNGDACVRGGQNGTPDGPDCCPGTTCKQDGNSFRCKAVDCIPEGNTCSLQGPDCCAGSECNRSEFF